MKILLIHNKYGKFSGEEAVVESQINLLRENAYEVITYFKSSEDIEMMLFGKAKAFLLALYNSEAIKEIKQLILKEKPDIVHVHNLYPLISPGILPEIKKMGIPIVMTVHNYRLICPNGLFFNNGEICEKCAGHGKEWNCVIDNCEKSFFKSTGYALRNFWARKKKYYLSNMDAFFCLTDFQKNKLVENGYTKAKINVLPNFYNKEIKDVGYEYDKRNYVAFSGRISPEKGVHLLLEAAKELPEIPFYLAGGVRDDFLKDLSIPENVVFKGMLNKEQLHEFYANARFLVLSSIWYEGFPMVFPEAMAHKLPLIAPEMAGFGEMATPDNGLLFKPGDAFSLSDTIKKLWYDKELCVKLGNNSLNMVRQRFSKVAYMQGLDHTYQKIGSSNN